jgi:hypothetical protein
VTLSAPTGTRFATFRWAGELRRTDCRYALQMWAEATDLVTPIKNVRANQHCPRPRRIQTSGYTSENFVVANTTRIVQRVTCVGRGRRKYCSARGSNYILTEEAEVRIVDALAPTATIVANTPLARGEWVGGTQLLNYVANDNVGVRMAKAIGAGGEGGTQQRPCAFATPEGSFATQVPCPNGPGHISVDTRRFTEGTQALSVRAQDTADNVANSRRVTARIDNSPPGRVNVGVEGGDAWRNTSDFTLVWANPPEADRAPIAAATYKLCPVGPGACVTSEQQGAGISRLGVRAPAPGEWNLSLWRRDAAGNQTAAAESVPVRLRYDPEPPQLAFEPPSANDPTLVAVAVKDAVSGLAGGTIEIGPAGSGAWRALPTRKDGNRLLARIDDIAQPAGAYQLRARAFDQANNEASTDRRLDGQPMSVTLPLRIASSMQAGFERVRTIRQTIKRHGKQRVVRRRVTVLEPSARIRSGADARVAGRLVNREGDGIAGAQIRIFSASSVSPEQLIAVVPTDAEGRFRYTAAGSASRTLRLAYAGSPLVLPAQQAITMSVPALTSLRVDHRRVVNGQSVTFRGKAANAARSRDRQADRAASPAVQPLADVPHLADRRRRAVDDSLPVQAHARRATVPVPCAPAARRWLSLRRRRVETNHRTRARCLMCRPAMQPRGRGPEVRQGRTRAIPRPSTSYIRERDVDARGLHRTRGLVLRSAQDRRSRHREPVDPGQEAPAQLDNGSRGPGVAPERSFRKKCEPPRRPHRRGAQDPLSK